MKQCLKRSVDKCQCGTNLASAISHFTIIMSATNTDDHPEMTGRRVLPCPNSSVSLDFHRNEYGWLLTCDTSYAIENDASGPRPLPPQADKSLIATIMKQVLDTCELPAEDTEGLLSRVREHCFRDWVTEHEGQFALPGLLSRTREHWFRDWVTEHKGQIALRPGAPDDVQVPQLDPKTCYHIDTGRGGTYYRALGSPGCLYKGPTAPNLDSAHPCTYKFISPEPLTVWAVKSKNSLTMSFGEGVAVELCHPLARPHWRSIPEDVVPKWRDIARGSDDMGRVAQVVSTFVRQQGQPQVSWRGKTLHSKSQYVLDKLAGTLRDAGVTCSDMRSFPLDEDVPPTTPSGAFFHVRLPANDSLIERALEKMNVIVVSEGIVACIHSGNRSCVEEAIRAKHHQQWVQDDEMARQVDQALIKWGMDDAESRKVEVLKVRVMVSDVVDGVIIQLSAAVDTRSDIAKWEDVIRESTTATGTLCRSLMFAGASCRKWEVSAKVAFGQVNFGRDNPGLYPELGSRTVNTFIGGVTRAEGANAVLVTVTTDYYPELDCQEGDRSREEAKFVIPLPPLL